MSIPFSTNESLFPQMMRRFAFLRARSETASGPTVARPPYSLRQRLCKRSHRIVESSFRPGSRRRPRFPRGLVTTRMWHSCELLPCIFLEGVFFLSSMSFKSRTRFHHKLLWFSFSSRATCISCSWNNPLTLCWMASYSEIWPQRLGEVM